jgi:predicted AlkP superfamily pyrophosphatase or phosphodiesterase
VVVVGIDGLRGDAVEQAQTPNMHKLMVQGASTLKAKAVFPTVSSPNWASIIMGATPKTHRIFSNDWQPGQTPPFPTIFDAIHARYKKAHIAVAYEWGGFGRLFNHDAVDFDATSLLNAVKPDPNTTPAQAVTRAAVDIIKKDKPTLTFVHLDLVDHAGHASGYGTPEYLTVVGEADRYLGEILKAIADAGVADKTVVIVVADHGGKEKSHGAPSPEETYVPWIVAGPRIAAGKMLVEPVSVAQTAPTIARILRVKCPKVWTEKPVIEAFGKR